VSERPFELPRSPEEERRSAFPWIVLGLLLAFLISGQLAGYLARGASSGDPNRAVESTFRQMTMAYEIQERLHEGQAKGRKGEATARGDARDRIRQEIENLARGLEDRLKSDSEAALLHAAMHFVIRREVDFGRYGSSTRRLSKSKQTALKVLSGQVASPEEARAASREITGGSLPEVLARTRAQELAGDKDARTRAFPTPKLIAFSVLNAAHMFGLSIGGILLVVYAIGRRNGKWRPLGHPVGQLSGPDADRFALRTGQLLSVYLIVSFAVQAAASDLADPYRALAQTLLFLTGAILLFKVPVWDKMIELARLGLEARNLVPKLTWALCGLLANLPLLIIAHGISMSLFQSLPEPEHPLMREVGSHGALGYAALFVSAGLIGPVFEEIVFRGTLLPALSSLFRSPFWGIVVSSLIFGAIHPTGIPAWAPLAMVGAMAAMLTYQTRSLVPAIALHVMHNSSLLVYSWAIS